MARLLAAVVALWAAAAPLLAHPHPGDVVTDTFRGRVTEVNLERHTVAIDRQTKKLRNYFFFLDPKVKITRGKQRVAISDVTPGDAVVCVAEVELNERGEATRYIAFDIRFDPHARPAVY